MIIFKTLTLAIFWVVQQTSESDGNKVMTAMTVHLQCLKLSLTETCTHTDTDILEIRLFAYRLFQPPQATEPPSPRVQFLCRFTTALATNQSVS